MQAFTSVNDFQVNAKNKLPPDIFNYFASGADDEITVKSNRSAFSKYAVCPRVCTGGTSIDFKTKLFGKVMQRPFGFSPSAMQKLAHPQGEQIPAQLAFERGLCVTLSTLSTTSLQQSTCYFDSVRESNRDGLRFLQLYINRDRSITLTMIRLAEQYGFGGLVITVDAQVLGKRIGDIKNKFSSPEGTKFEILEEIHRRIQGSSKVRNLNRKEFVDNRDLGLDWSFISWVRSITKLPIILKGICSAEDAQLAVQYAVDAIWVSNHGGRQLDTVRASVDILVDVAKSVANRIKDAARPYVFVDGGIRSGSDIFKCLALGADYVFVGRPLVYSLVEGYEGVKRMIDLLTMELGFVMQATGNSKVGSINKSSILQLRAKL